MNPDHIVCYGNKRNVPKHTSAYYKSKVKVCGDEINITRFELDEYIKTHEVCEICGRRIEECVKWVSKFSPKRLCIDHDHETKEFRGLLCSRCNRQLGWYEKYKENIEAYLNK